MELPVVNHKDYVAKIGDDHKFPINKFGELAKYLIDRKVIKKFYTPVACSFETLNRAHSKNYINDIKNKTLDSKLQKKIGFPINDSVVRRSFVATGGTVLASKLALDYKLACNTAGGSHHANFDSGAGYCVFNDVAGYLICASRLAFNENPTKIFCDLKYVNGIDISGNMYMKFSNKTAICSFSYENYFQSSYNISGEKGIIEVERAFN